MKAVFIALILAIISVSVYFFLSQDKPVGAIVERADEINIIYPRDLEEVQRTINIKGKANPSFKFVEVQVDLNGWNKVSGTENWNYLLDTSKLSPGIHTVYIRASDNAKYSKVKAVRINIK